MFQTNTSFSTSEALNTFWLGSKIVRTHISLAITTKPFVLSSATLPRDKIPTSSPNHWRQTKWQLSFWNLITRLRTTIPHTHPQTSRFTPRQLFTTKAIPNTTHRHPAVSKAKQSIHVPHSPYASRPLVVPSTFSTPEASVPHQPEADFSSEEPGDLLLAQHF